MQEAGAKHTFGPDKVSALETWLISTLDLNELKINDYRLLAGGAIGENWRLDVTISEDGDGPVELDGDQMWVLRTDAPAKLFLSHNRGDEYELSKLAYAHGVAVPRPIVNCLDADVIGAPFMIAEFAAGSANGRKVVRDPELSEFGDELAAYLGAELAKIHKITPEHADLRFMKPAGENPALTQVALLYEVMARVSQPRPALELALSWLAANAPVCDKFVLCHGDYRTGNYLVEDGRLTAILDWEFAHWGDRHLDIGWFCARCWRFGNIAQEAGGIAAREVFYSGYDEVADEPLDRDVIPYWEVMTATRWAAVALLQAERHLTGGEENLELLLTGQMAPEIELEALRGIEAIKNSRWSATT